MSAGNSRIYLILLIWDQNIPSESASKEIIIKKEGNDLM